jgi:hypothetical protein
VRYLRHNALYEILNDVSEQNIPLLVKGLILMGSFCILSMISKMVFLPILSLIGLAVVFLSVNTTYVRAKRARKRARENRRRQKRVTHERSEPARANRGSVSEARGRERSEAARAKRGGTSEARRHERSEAARAKRGGTSEARGHERSSAKEVVFSGRSGQARG